MKLVVACRSVLGSLLLLGGDANAAVVDGNNADVARSNNRFAFDVTRSRTRRGVKINNLDHRHHSTTSSMEVGGGGIRDNIVTVDPSLSFKDQTSLSRIALGSILQTFLLYTLASRLGSYNPPLRAMALLTIVFGSSYFGSIIDMMPSAATRQLLDPNNIPGNADWYANLKKPRWNPP